MKTKPHLRLHYTPAKSPGNRSGAFPWSVEYMRGPNTRARRETYQHDTAWGAMLSAEILWFPKNPQFSPYMTSP